MPRGDKSKYTAKQQHQAEQIKVGDTERDRRISKPVTWR
jgi:hypothetical protein